MQDWLTQLIEKNAWAIIVAFVSIVIVYANLSSEIQAQAAKIDKLELAVSGIIDNQKSIIILQQQQQVTSEDLSEIKQDIKDIKRSLGQ